MKFPKYHALKSITWVIVSLLFLQACKKDPDNIGADIIPESAKPKLEYTDTISVRGYSLLVDSLRTDESNNSLFGSMMDPVFGRSNAAFYTQFRLPAINPDFGNNPVVDSVILSLEYAGAYGDINSPLRMHVYELADQIFKDELYYSDVELSDYGFDYADYTFVPQPYDYDTADGDTIAYPILNVNLSRFTNELGEKIINADSAYLSDNELFTEYFKGLYVKPEIVNDNGSILYFDLLSGNSRMTIYYTNDTASLSYVLAINENTARINTFNHDYGLGSPEFIEQVVESDSSLGNEQLFLQSMGGVRARLFFPYIAEFKQQGNVLINEAKLVVPVQSADTVFEVPRQLGLLRSTDNDNFEFMIDQIETPIIFGGDYDPLNNSYTFRITRYMQKLLQGDYKDNGINLYITAPASNAWRVILSGAQAEVDPDKQLRLELRYSLPE